MRGFVIEDTTHCEWMGEFDEREDALVKLKRLESIPFDEEPNKAPCTSWRTCGRSYELIEFDTATDPWTEVSREAVLEISAPKRPAIQLPGE